MRSLSQPDTAATEARRLTAMPELQDTGSGDPPMAQQRGVKRAQKVLKRKQRQTRLDRKSEVKKLVYAAEKTSAAIEGKHDHADHSKHDHD